MRILQNIALACLSAISHSAAAEPLSPDDLKRREEWRAAMSQTPLPKEGCFESSYPEKVWKEVRCGKAPSIPMTPRRAPRPFVVGNRNSISAQAPSGFISAATGTFDNVTGVTSLVSPIGNTGAAVNDAYSLQLNTDFFASSACAGSPHAGCLGWEQFVFFNDGAAGFLFIQYWLIRYNATCPEGWNTFSFAGSADIYCWRNSTNAAAVPNQPIANLGQMRLTGAVSTTGDNIAFATAAAMYAATGDNSVNAAAGWTIAEFNVFGAGGGGEATFNAGSTVVPRTRITYGGNAAPVCVADGFTGETNNLSFGPTAPAASGPGPAVFFTESSAGGAASNCAAATAVGDPHLSTYHGLFYDFQASGDFVLAEVDTEFVVQARKVSGAPTWPDASVNHGVATRMGAAEVAVCLMGEGRDPTTRLFVDRAPANLADGASLPLPDGTVVLRRGNVYQIVSRSGNSVRAVVNPTWIDVTVGLGRWPARVRGLLANAQGDPNRLEARDGTVLTNPFAFEAFYRRYGESWRVPTRASLLSVCGDKGIAEAIPEKPFHAKDLDPNQYRRANAVCAAAGVAEGPLLDACILDVTVLGNELAAQVFVGMPKPVAVGEILPPNRRFPPGFLMWAVPFILLALILWFLVRKARKAP